MNDFRSKILGGEASGPSLLGSKAPRRPREQGDALGGDLIPREASRSANHRDADRHRLHGDESVCVRWRRKRFDVKLINLSGGGAMIEVPFTPEMWDRMEIDLGRGDRSGRIECAVRWIRGNRVGLEFAHETRIDADPEARAGLLREVIARCFSDVVLEAEVAQPSPTGEATAAETEIDDPQVEAGPVDDSRRAKARHPLIWSGTVHWDHDSHPVRLRNVSETGALVESATRFPEGAELFMELGEAGSVFARVSWSRGDQTGLEFQTQFDIARLAAAKPKLAPGRWAKPEYLRDESPDSSPWASQWGRLSLSELHKTLGR